MNCSNFESFIKFGRKFSSNLIGNSNSDCPHKLLLTNTKVSKIRKAFVNGPFSKMIESGGVMTGMIILLIFHLKL